MSGVADITKEVRALERLGLQDVREAWRRRYGPPPRTRSADLLRACLAWRLQVAVYGGLDGQTRKILRGAAEATPEVREGVLIRKEWRGRTYEVDRIENGYRWNGTTYPSLSAAAQAISGVKRNGPKFFGLREGASP